MIPEINRDITVTLELYINHETHWAYCVLGHFYLKNRNEWINTTSFAIEIMNGLTVVLRREHHIIVKNLSAIPMDKNDMGICIYFEQDHDAARSLVSAATSQTLETLEKPARTVGQDSRPINKRYGN